MTPGIRRAAFAAICTFYAGVGFAAQTAGDADSKEIAAYTLTLDGLRKVVNVNRTMMQQMMQDPKVRESLKVDAELAALSKKDELTAADEKRIEELEARKEQLENDADNPLGGGTRSRLRKWKPASASSRPCSRHCSVKA